MSYKAIGKSHSSNFLISFLLHFIMIWAKKCLDRDHGSSFPWHFMSLGVQILSKLLFKQPFKTPACIFSHLREVPHLWSHANQKNLISGPADLRGFWWDSGPRSQALGACPAGAGSTAYPRPHSAGALPTDSHEPR